MKETQTTQKSKQFLWKRTNQSEHIYWSLKRVARNLLPIRKQREREEKSRSKAIERWTNERKPIELVCFLFWIETNEDTRTKTLRLSSLWLSIPFIHSVHFSLVLRMCVYVLKCNYFCLSWCTIHQLLGPPFSFGNFSRLPFLTVSFYCYFSSCSANYLFRSISSIHSLSLLSFCWHCVFFLSFAFFCAQLFLCATIFMRKTVCATECVLWVFVHHAKFNEEREKETKGEKV